MLKTLVNRLYDTLAGFNIKIKIEIVRICEHDFSVQPIQNIQKAIYLRHK